MSVYETSIERIEALIRRFEQSADPQAKNDATELVQSLMDLHGASIARIVSLLADHGATGQKILNEMIADDGVSALLLLYGLHPLLFTERVQRAVETLQQVLQSHGACVEIVDIVEGIVRLRLISKGNGCQSSGAQIRQLVQDAIIGAAPDLAGLQIEEIEPEPKLVALRGVDKNRTNTGAQAAPVT